MASCYHSAASFRDIAFNLRGKEKIHDRWRMICHGDIRASFEVLDANDDDGHVKLVDESMKTLPRVRTEMSLHVLAYNLKRVMNILGVTTLLSILKFSGA